MENNIEYYQDQIIEMFYMSIDNNIEKWTQNRNNEDDFYSEYFGKHQLNIDMGRKKLFLRTVGQSYFTYICAYKFWFIPINFKMNRYVKKLKRYFETKDDVTIMKDCLKIMGETYVKEVRKEKLCKLQN